MTHTHAIPSGFHARARARRFLSTPRLILLTVFVSVSSVATLRWTCADLGDVYSASMEPTIVEGDRVIVNKLAYGVRLPFGDEPFWNWSQPSRGEIVVFRSPVDGRYLIKRVIGLPGDRIRMYRNTVYVNGTRAYYARPRWVMGEILDGDEKDAQRIEPETIGDVTHFVQLTSGVESPNSFDTIIVPADQYFVMGDNRDLSIDSRVFGFVDGDAIMGRVNQVAVSFDPDEGFALRWDRLFEPLV